MEEKKKGIVRHVIVLGILVVMIVCLVPIMDYLTEMAVTELGYGVRNTEFDKFGVLIYLAVVTVSYALLYVLHRRQIIAEEGTPVFVDYVKKLFSWSVGIVIGMIGGLWLGFFLMFLLLIFWDYTGINMDFIVFSGEKTGYIILMILVGLVCYLFAEIIVRQIQKIKTIDWKGCGEFLLVAALCFGAWYGLGQMEETKVPALTDVESAYIDMDPVVFFTQSECKVEFQGEESRKIIDIHRKIIEDLDYYEQLDTDIEKEYMIIKYTLKDGTVLSRAYRIPNDGIGQRVIDEITAMELAPERFLQKVIAEKYDEVDRFETGYMNIAYYKLWKDRAIKGAEEKEITLTSSECESLYQAIVADGVAGNLFKYNSFDICSKHGGIEESEEKQYDISIQFINPETEELEALYLDYGKDCTNILNELAKLGYIDSAETFCWEDVYLVQPEPEVYLERVFCYDYEVVEGFGNTNLDIGYYVETDDGTRITEHNAYVPLEETQAKVLYDAIIKDWIDGTLLKYNILYCSDSSQEEYTGDNNVFTIYIEVEYPEWVNYKDVELRYGSDCKNIIQAIVDLGIVKSAEDICWENDNWTNYYDSRVKAYTDRLSSYKDREMVIGEVFNLIEPYMNVIDASQSVMFYETVLEEMTSREFLEYNYYQTKDKEYQVNFFFKNPNSGVEDMLTVYFGKDCEKLMELFNKLGLQ